MWKSFVSGGDFCLVQNSNSLRDVVALWDESGFAWSSVSLRPQGSLRVVVSHWFVSRFGWSSDSFASKVPLAMWSPFGMSLASVGSLSRSGFKFLWRRGSPFHPHSARLAIRSSSGSFLCVFPWWNDLCLHCGFAYRGVLWHCS